jgi:COP9 signalosome complex subunit 5|tara:strand:- start:635 stop:937 length:303 start_codon:yes stop_codon:yes gene_type:complete
MKFELENNFNEVVDDKDFYYFDEDAVEKVYKEKPWKKDENYYKKVKISATALIKMVMHAKSGGNIEVMGLMQGKVVGDTFWIMDSFALPVEASETRVNAA